MLEYGVGIDSDDSGSVGECVEGVEGVGGLVGRGVCVVIGGAIVGAIVDSAREGVGESQCSVGSRFGCARWTLSSL